MDLSFSWTRRVLAPASIWFVVAFAAAAPGWALVISEIFYHPPTGQESLEFLELTNDAFSPEDISGWEFVEGIRFVIPPGTVLEGGETIAICADVDAVKGHYRVSRALGNYSGTLDAAGERLTLVNHAGVVIQSLRYRDRGEWPAAADGTGHSLILANIHGDSSQPRHWLPSPELGGSPAEANFFEDRIGYQDTVFIGLDQPWRYQKGWREFSIPAEAWRELSFDDSEWAVGLPGFGYGDDDDVTVLDDMRETYTSLAIRLRFTLTEAEVNDRVSPLFEINYDDGFCAFLNGTEFARVNCPELIQWDSTSTRRREAQAGSEETFELPRKAVRVGENVLAVVGFNASLRDSDFSLIPRVLVRHFDEFHSVDPVGVVFNELFRDSAGNGWVELYNTDSVAHDLGGLTVSDAPDGTAPYTFPAGTMIGPGRFLVLGQVESGLSLSDPEVALFLRTAAGFVLGATVFDRGPPPDLEGTPYAEARFPDGGPAGWVTPTPTSASANQVPVVSDLVVNEIHYHPPQGRAGEFIELFHRGRNVADGGVALDLSGFRFSEGIDYTFPDGFTILPGEYVVVAANPTLMAEQYGLRDALGPFDKGVLSNRGERLRLLDSLGNVVDEVRYYDGGEWSRWADGRGSTLELIDPHQHNDLGGAWAASDESEKAAWETHSFTFAHPPLPTHSELRLFLVERGECLVDAVEMTTDMEQFEVLIESGDEWRFRRGTGPYSDPEDAWQGEGFDDSSWDVGPSGFGFGDNDDRTVLDDMSNGYVTVAIRKRVVLTEEQATGRVFFGLLFDDGFCAFVNGELVVCENQPEDLNWQSLAPKLHEAREEEFFEIPAGLLRAGENTIAIQGFNRRLQDPDFSLEPRLLRVTGIVTSGNLIANGDFETDVSDWRLRGTHQQTERIESDSFAGNAALRIVATSKGDGQCNGIEAEIDPRLEKDQSYDLSFATRWQRGSDLLLATGGFATGRWRGTRDVNMSGNSFTFPVRMTVPWNLGTPGEENSVRRRRREEQGLDNLGPLFADVLHSPPTPAEDVPVTVRARVLDSDGVARVRVLYQMGTDEAAEYIPLELQPSGADVYTNVLPARGESGRVLFYLEAEDTTGATSTYPASAPSSPLVYQAGLQAASLHVLTSDRSLNPGGIMSNELVSGTVVHDDEVFYNVGMRYRGSPWGRPQRQSLRLRFPKDRLFKGTRRDINVSQRDRENDGPAHFIVVRNGTPEHPAPGSDYKYIRARLNGRSWGTPGLFEAYDRRFVTKWFGVEAANDGVLLKGNGRISFDDGCSNWRWDEATLHYRDGKADNYRFYYNHSINQSRDNWEPFARLTGLLDETVTDDKTLDETFETVIDFESFIRTFGPRMMVGDGDALFVANGHNGFLFWDPTEELWHYLCVDFGGWHFNAAGNLLSVRDRGLSRLMGRPRPRRLYYNMLNDYMHGYWNPDVAGPYFSALRAMASVSLNGGFASSRNAVLGRIRPFVEAPFRFLSESGGELVEIVGVPPDVTLRGEAPVTMMSFLLQEDGEPPEPLALELTSPTEWTTTIATSTERRTIQVLGFDREGGLIGTTSVTIVTAQPSGFIRGDVNGDARVNITDPLATLTALFRGGRLFCSDAADVNDDGQVNVADVLASLEFTFSKAAPPAPPFPDAGPDPSEDALDCRR